MCHIDRRTWTALNTPATNRNLLMPDHLREVSPGGKAGEIRSGGVAVRSGGVGGGFGVPGLNGSNHDGCGIPVVRSPAIGHEPVAAGDLRWVDFAGGDVGRGVDGDALVVDYKGC